MGWIGPARQLRYALEMTGADKDAGGKFKVYNSAPCSFMGLGEECVIDDECCYTVNGKKVSIAGLMASTSYGTQVTVI